MGGRGKRGKPTTNTRAGAGRGSVPPPAQFAAAPNPPQSAWGRPAPAPAPATTQSAWGAPAPAPIPAQSAWGRPAPAAAPTQSAWGNRAPASAPNPVNGQSLPRVPAETSGYSGRPRDQPLQSRQQQGAQQQPRDQGAQPREQVAQQREQGAQQQPREQGAQPREPRTYVGYNGTAIKANRGSIRDRQAVRPDIAVTINEGVSKRGKTGQVVPLTTNYFRLIKKPGWQIYQYRVDFRPQIENQRFMKKLINDQKVNLGGFLFDGTILFLCKKLHNDVTEFMIKDRDENPIQITVKFVKLISMLTADSIQILNLILRRSMGGLDLQLVGRNFYDAVAKISVTQRGLELWPGYDTSIRQHETDILMCAQITTKVMRTETIFDIMYKYYGKPDFKDNFSKEIVGMTVLTQYNNKTYKIYDVTFDITPMDTFNTTKDGVISFVDYYQKKHKITIRDPNQPMLITRSTQRSVRGGQPDLILLIPELCRATGFTDAMRNDRWLMEDVAKHTRINPEERIAKLIAFNQRLQTTAASVANFAEWDFQLDKQLVQLNGRKLPVETVFFGNGTKSTEKDWASSFRKNSMYCQQPLRNWVVIVPKKKLRETQEFINILRQAADGMRYEIRDPNWIDLNDDFGRSYSNAIDAALNKDPQLVMCIMMGISSEKYSIVKKKCCVERAIPSQVMLAKTITPKQGKLPSSLLSVGTKVAIQINAKLGGAPWMVSMPSGIMVVGFDVCHDTNDKSKSYGALVATMDMTKSPSYFSAVAAHKDGQELCNSFAFNMGKALTCYGTKHKVLPERIFIYRDGVGEGQTDYVREHEIKAIQGQLDRIYRGSPYKLLFVVVSKRINTRFFLNGTNPQPGTVVDDVVTLPERHDFYMISPSVRHGTVSPTNYNILFNTSGLSSDEIQKFTFKMTYLYYNWTSTLAVPAVCQYAHKLAFLVGNFIHQSPSGLLENKLYFL